MSNTNNTSNINHEDDDRPHPNPRSTTPLDFDFSTSTPWEDQDFQDLAIQALNAATATDDDPEEQQQEGAVVDHSNFIGTTSSSSAHVHDHHNKNADDDVNDLNDDDMKKPAASEQPEVRQGEQPLEEKPSKKRDYEAHTITGAIAPAPTVSRRKKKPKGMPKRPLSAYNVFFQKERINVLAEAAASGSVRSSSACSSSNNSNAVSFEDLGKIIGRRWKSLSFSERKQYEDSAQDDAERYKSEMEVFQEAKRLRNQRQLTYQPECSNNNDFGGRFSRLSRPPDIKSLPYNHPVRAQFPGQHQPVDTWPVNHPPDWGRQQLEPPAAAAAVNNSNNDSDHQFPIPPGTERKWKSTLREGALL